MKLAVLNPGGNDPEQHFPDFAGAPDGNTHAPVNFHGFAACTGGGFYRKEAAIPADTKHVVLLLRHDLKACRQALIDLRGEKKTVAISFKEAGAFQIAELLANTNKLRLVTEICERADGAIATTPDLVPFLTGCGARTVEFIPTPYPVEDPRWNFAQPIEERRGIFIGTREFNTLSRNHLAALIGMRYLCEAMQEPVTVFNMDGWGGRRLLAGLRYPEPLLRVVEGRKAYPDYLKLVARHKIVFQLDASAVPGQVAGDALLCRVPCIGGNGTTERLVFPNLCGHGRTHEQLFDLTARLLEHPHDCEALTIEAEELANNRLSFGRAARQLEDFFNRIAR
ncbi:MAG: hypothetical protein JWL90_4166 [Chthoniobacteraceae bacterium]|nr:hypothetical protein [Chthoniobacteraceae bacterium]